MSFFFSNKRSILSSAAVISLYLLLILGGCEIEDRLGLSDENTLTPEGQNATSTAVNNPSENAATSVSTETVQTITLWLPPQFNPESGLPAGELLKNRLASFTEENSHVIIETRIKAESGSGGLLDSLTITNSIAPDNLPSLILLRKSDFETAAENGLIYPISGIADPLEEPDWFSYARELAYYQDVQYGIPFASDPLVLAYQANLSENPPKTWQEASMKNGVLSFPAGDVNAIIPLAMYQGAGGSYWDSEGKFALQAEPLLKVDQTLQNGVYFGAFPYWLTEFITFDESWNAFLTDRATYTTVWASDALSDTTVKKAITFLPSYSSTPFTFTDGWLICVATPAAENTTMSLELAEYLMDPEFQKEWSEAAGYVPVQKSALAAWKNQTLASTLTAIAESAVVLPSNDLLTRAGIIMEESTSNLLNQRVNATQAAEQAMEEIQTQD